MEAAAAALEADAPVDDIDIITAGVDELGENDQFAVLKALVRNADVEGVQRHLEVLDYNGATVSARSLGLAARLPLTVHYGDAAVHGRSRAVMLLVVAACNEQTLGQCVVNTTHWTHEYAPGRRGSQFPPYVGGDAFLTKIMQYAVTVLHQFAWDGDTEALATVLALPECSARLVNATTRSKVNHAFTRTLEMKPGITPLHLALMAGQAPIVRLLLADGRADPNYLTNDGATPLVDSALGAVMWDGRLNHRIAEAVRVLTRDPRTNVDVWYNKKRKLLYGRGRNPVSRAAQAREVRVPRNYLPRAGGAAESRSGHFESDRKFPERLRRTRHVYDPDRDLRSGAAAIVQLRHNTTDALVSDRGLERRRL